MSNPDSPEVERILERLRLQMPAAPSSTPDSVAAPAYGNADDPREELPAPDLTTLRAEIHAALLGHRDFGQINPRPPGLVRGLVQLAKKVVRRGLSWYTRPQHIYQGAVIRALQQTVSGLETQQYALRLLDDRSAQVDAIATQLDARTTAIATRTSRVEARMSEVENRGMLEERRAAGRQRGVDEKLDYLQRLIVEQRAALERQFAQEFETAHTGLSTQFHEQKDELAELRRRQQSQERDVRRLNHAVDNGGTAATVVAPSAPAPAKVAFDYFAFEDRYRGDEALVRDRQLEYLQYFRDRSNVVDLGCGRGEFLALLGEHGISARGVELGLDQYLWCREKGLDVVQEDLLAFLEAQPDESLGGIFSAQVIEHFPASEQLRFVSLAYRKTSAGSPVIFETINALSVFAVLNNYLVDPTHVRIVHPEMLRFAMESMNFRDVTLKFMSPVPNRPSPALHLSYQSAELDRFNSAIGQLNDLIYGPQDFAAIGWH